jgi:hypothetical protein
MERYKRRFVENNFFDFSKKNFEHGLEGKIKNTKYFIRFLWYSKIFEVEVAKILEDGSSDMILSKQDGSPAQALSYIFHTVFKIPVPKNDDISSSGLDINLMLEFLIKKYKFKMKY